MHDGNDDDDDDDDENQQTTRSFEVLYCPKLSRHHGICNDVMGYLRDVIKICFRLLSPVAHCCTADFSRRPEVDYW